VVPALLLLGSLITVAAAVIGNGNLVVAAAPALLAVLLATVWLVPLRVPLMALIFVCLAVDIASEGPWESPVAPIGKLLFVNLAKSLPLPMLMLPGMAIIILLLVAIHVSRELAGVRTDVRGAVSCAEALPLALLVSFAAVAWDLAYGLKGGGNAQMAKVQVQTFVQLLLFAYLVAVAFRGQRDYRVLAGMVVSAACIKALMALWVVHMVPAELRTEYNFATSHGDSLLFAAATVFLIVRLLEAPSLRYLVTAGVILPLLFLGMSANNRRLVYVEIAAALILYWLIGHRTQMKRLVARVALASLPLIVAYVAVGWSSQSPIFAPVRIFRSVGDSDVDHSTLYRDLEDYNLLQTVRFSPLLGPGLGQPFAEVVKLPDISFFHEYRYMPHNSILGLWAFCGPFGFSGLMLTPIVGIYLASVAYRRASNAPDRIAAFMALAMIVMFLIHCWGDIGFSERIAIYLVGPALAMAGQLAVATGAWPMRRARG
jgi:hypothetical protein